MSLYYLPFLIQGIFMTVDEFYFHERRGLPLWEKIGHPLDSFFTLVTLSLPAFFIYNESIFKTYLGLSLFSCLFITKDEFIHQDRCTKTEHWIHSVLFILHPIILIITLLVWITARDVFFLKLQPVVVGSFMIYQILRWSTPWSK
jgi:hypothetical protein